ncbi:MAG TPA: thioredoxin family protein [Polyangiaceae bacterium]|jgi:thiol-disulfide isomerase/thioredoxin
MTRTARLALAIAVGSVVAIPLAGCRSQAEIAPDPGAGSSSPVTASATPPKPSGKLRLVAPAADGDVDAIVRAAMGKASAEKRRVVVYVGATWCEPCQRFHHAAEKGELDDTFPDVDFLAFDADHDHERLAVAGYTSHYIPLFALPQADGHASGMQIEGGIKGDGAVRQIAPRLQHMLEQ